MVSIGAGVVIDEVAGQHAVDQQSKFAGGGSDGFGLADADCQTAVKRPECGRSFPRAHRAAAQDGRDPIGGRLSPGTEQAPTPEILLLGASEVQEAKWY